MGSTLSCRILILPGKRLDMPIKVRVSASIFFSDEAKVAKRKLQMLSNRVFEELAMDVYDEVDRRETDAIWNGLFSKVSLRLRIMLIDFLVILGCFLMLELANF